MYAKDPDAILDYTVNWGDGYLEASEYIIGSSWSVSSTDLTLSGSTHSTSTATVTVAGGTHGVTYVLTNSITTSKNSRADDRTIVLRVWEPL